MDICGFWMSLQASATYNKKKKNISERENKVNENHLLGQCV